MSLFSTSQEEYHMKMIALSMTNLKVWVRNITEQENKRRYFQYKFDLTQKIYDFIKLYTDPVSRAS